MLDLKQLKKLARFADKLERILRGLEKEYSEKDSEGFFKNKKEILNIQKKISIRYLREK